MKPAAVSCVFSLEACPVMPLPLRILILYAARSTGLVGIGVDVGCLLFAGVGELWFIFTMLSGFSLSIFTFLRPKVNAAILPMPTRKAMRATAIK